MNAKQIKEQEAEDAIERHLDDCVKAEGFTNHGTVTGRMSWYKTGTDEPILTDAERAAVEHIHE